VKPLRKHKRCIPVLRPHAWHWDGYNEIDHILMLRCGRCLKYKTVHDWNPDG
jgi:hypothetical protein